MRLEADQPKPATEFQRSPTHPWLRYLHLLDGEEVVLRELEGNGRSAVCHEIERALKLYALVGCPIVLSDVQSTDSPVTLRLFADESFRKYLQENPSWLTVRARPYTEDAEAGTLGVLRSGWRRSQEKGWITSCFSDTGVARAVGARLLSLDAIDESALLSDGYGSIATECRTVEDRLLVKGAVGLMRHFLATSGARAERPPVLSGPAITYYDILVGVQKHLEGERNQARHDRELLTIELERVSSLITLIDQKVPKEDRHRRSALRAVLQEPHRNRFWRTTVQAWNCAVQESLSVPLTTYELSPLAVPIAQYVGKVVECAAADTGVVARARENRQGPLAHVQASWSRDLTELSWHRVREVATATANERMRYATVLGGADVDEQESAFGELLKAVGRRTAGDSNLSRLEWVFGAFDLCQLAYGVLTQSAA